MARLSDLGERRIIRALAEIMDHGDLVLGFDDDCAAVPVGEDFLLVSTDAVNRKTHIPPQATGRQVGWYTAAVNLSDIAAKGGRPLGLVVAMTLPRSLDLPYLKDIAKGLDACCRKFETRVIGGDTKEGPDISLAGTALGLVPRDRLMRRRGAKAGDVLAVTGELGRGGWGYLNRMKEPTAIKALMGPNPRITMGQLLARSGAVTSCMDLSDGLAASLQQLSEVSGVMFEVHWNRVPLFRKLKKEGEGTKRKAALHLGGDYELVFTVRTEAWEGLKREAMTVGERITAIGAACEGKENLLIGMETEPLGSAGYEHFT